jgi:xylulokinase
MTSPVVIGLDIGSASAKASAFTLDGALVAQGSVGYQPRQPEPGVAEYDGDELLEAALGALSIVGDRLTGRTVASIAIDAMMSGAVGIDAAGRPVTAYTTTLDTRFGPDLEEFTSRHGAALRQETGSLQATLAPKIAWLRRSEAGRSGRIAKYVLAGSLVGARLAGLDADGHYLDPTYLWTTGLADSRAGSWSTRLLEAAGVAPDELPRIVASTEVVGRLSRSAATRTGLPSGVPIVAGCGDQSAGYLGAGIRPGVAADSAGTYSVFAVASPEFLPGGDASAPDIAVAPQEGLFHYQHIVIGGGLTRQWATDLLLGSESGRAQDLAGLERLAREAPPGADGLTVVPFFGGTATPPDATVRGSIHGLTWTHRSPEIYRAVLESIPLDHALALRSMPTSPPIDLVVGYGGGARSGLWNQIKCDVLGVPYECLGEYPVTELGIALLGAQGVGLVDDAATAAEGLKTVESRLRPDPDRHEQYLRVLDHYAAVVSSTTEQTSCEGAAS